MIEQLDTRWNILADLIKTANRTEGKHLTATQYDEHGNFSRTTVHRRFGSFVRAKKKAGLYGRAPLEFDSVTREQIIDDMHVVAEKAEGLITTNDFDEYGEYSIDVVYDHFDSFFDLLDELPESKRF
jgi:hypothetical protein